MVAPAKSEPKSDKAKVVTTPKDPKDHAPDSPEAARAFEDKAKKQATVIAVPK